MSDTHDWFRTILLKKTNYFRDMNVRSINFVKKIYKKVKASPPDLKPEGCDYYFDIIKFCKYLIFKFNKFVYIIINSNI